MPYFAALCRYGATNTAQAAGEFELTLQPKHNSLLLYKQVEPRQHLCEYVNVPPVLDQSVLFITTTNWVSYLEPFRPRQVQGSNLRRHVHSYSYLRLLQKPQNEYNM